MKEQCFYDANMFLVKISQVEEREIFKICLEHWLRLVSELYEEMQRLPILDMPTLSLAAGGAVPSNAFSNANLRKNLYPETLSALRKVMIERMVKPEEVCLTLSFFGESMCAIADILLITGLGR